MINIEPNIIVDLLEYLVLKLIFKEIFEKEIGLKYIMKNLDDNNKVRDTGKIFYASMYVNGEEINLYNFEFKNRISTISKEKYNRL